MWQRLLLHSPGKMPCTIRWRQEWLVSDLFTEVKGEFDVIVSNPPYIATRDLEELMPEVICHEPKRALDGHEDGLYFYRKIIEQAPLYLKPGGRLLFEIGYDHGRERPGSLGAGRLL